MTKKITKDKEATLLVSIKLIKENNLERLRHWKNKERKFFFHDQMITSTQQLEWYKNYQDEINNYMFIVTTNNIPIGCMGIRLKENKWDIYNIILGLSKFQKKGIMSTALKIMIEFALSKKDTTITLKVLIKNPAVKWYLNNDFEIIKKYTNYYYMRLKK